MCITAKSTAADTQIHVEHGTPLLFGKNKEKGLRLDPQRIALEVVDAESNADGILHHDETNRVIAHLLLEMRSPEFPVALGVILRQPAETFEHSFYTNHPTGFRRTAKVADVLRRTNTWRVD